MSANGDGVVVLTGNGLSVAANPDLALGNISEHVWKQLAEQYPDSREALLKISKVLGKNLAGHGERDGEEAFVQDFEKLASVVNELREAVLVLQEFGTIDTEGVEKIQKLECLVLHLILRYIEEHSKGDTFFGSDKCLNSILETIVSNFGRVHLVNLNYDQIMLRAFLSVMKNAGEGMQFYDDARGGTQARFKTQEIGKPDGYLINGASQDSNEPGVFLHHPHGSFTFWGHVDSDTFVKVPSSKNGHMEPHKLTSMLIQELRVNPDDDADGVPNTLPQVILCGPADKATKIQTEPFNIIVSNVNKAFTSCDRWIIIGYSFRDAHINRMLREAYRPGETQILVCDKRTARTFGEYVDAYSQIRDIAFSALARAGEELSEQADGDEMQLVHREDIHVHVHGAMSLVDEEGKPCLELKEFLDL